MSHYQVWRAPTGATINRTLEMIPATCGITTWHGPVPGYDFDGSGADVNWDGQETVERAGEVVFLDDDGNEWLESQVIKDPEAPLPTVMASAWSDPDRVRKLLESKFDAAMEVILADLPPAAPSIGQQSQRDALLKNLTDLALWIRKDIFDRHG